jgi:phage tail-like protein
MSRFEYPPVGFRFSLSIGSRSGVDASFSEVSGISAQLTTEEIIEGGENRFKHRFPLQLSYTPLVLKRGVADSSSPLLTWISNTFSLGLTKPLELKNITVNLLNERSEPLISWVFEGAYPIKYDISGLKADSNQIAIETIELSYKSFSVF